MSNQISNQDNVIDSRDIIKRIEELEEELQDACEGEGNEQDFDIWLEQATDNSEHTLHDAAHELRTLRCIADECEGYGDWKYGESLIREDYFTDYIEELINDCYELPKGLNSGEWPYCHMTMDYEAAAEDAKADYMEVDFDGVTYFMRCV
jgi:hypothetical protein